MRKIKPSAIAVVVALFLSTLFLTSVFGMKDGFLRTIDRVVEETQTEAIEVNYFPTGLLEGALSKPVIDPRLVLLLSDSQRGIAEVALEQWVGPVATAFMGDEKLFSGFSLISVSTGFARVRGLSIKEGRWLDDHGLVNECVVSPQVAKNHGLAVGSTLGPNAYFGHQLVVCGILNEIADEFGERFSDRVFVRYPYAPKLRSPGGDVAGPMASGRYWIVPVQGEADIAIGSIRRAVDTYTNGAGAVTLRVPNTLKTSYVRIREGYAGAYALVGGVALLVASMGLASLLLAEGATRVRATGIRRALGATRSSVQNQFLSYGLALSSMGIGAGLLAGTLTAPLLGNLLHEEVLVRIETVVLVGILGLITCGLASFIPASAIASVDPIQAIREPQSVRYYRSRIFRLLAATGVAVVVICISIVGSTQLVATDRIDAYMDLVGDKSISITELDPFSDAGAQRLQLNEELVDVFRGLPGLVSIGYLETGQALVSGDGGTDGASVIRCAEGAITSHSLVLAAGRYPLSPGECVIGSTLAAGGVCGGMPLGCSVFVGSVQLQVVGILEALPRGVVEEGWDRDWAVIVMHKEQVELPAGFAYREMRLKFETVEAAGSASSVIAGDLRMLTDGGPGYSIRRPFVEAATLKSLRLRQGSVFLLFSVLTALIAVINLTNYMFIRTKSAQRSIAIRRALGASQAAVLMSTVTESLKTCMLGGVLGALVSFVLVVYVFPSPAGFLVAVVRTGLLGFLSALIVGTLGSALPAIAASRIDPAVVLSGGES